MTLYHNYDLPNCIYIFLCGRNGPYICDLFTQSYHMTFEDLVYVHYETFMVLGDLNIHFDYMENSFQMTHSP